LQLLGFGPETKAALLFLLPTVLGVVLFRNLRRIDQESNWEGKLPGDVKARIDKTVSVRSPSKPLEPTAS